MLKGRNQSSIVRQCDSDSNDFGSVELFEHQIKSLAVVSRERDTEIFDQINAIMGIKSKHKSVEAAVEDMKNRSGITAYLNNVKTSSEFDGNDSVNKKIASEDEGKLPKLIMHFPDVKHTLENYIRDTKGNKSLPAIIDRARSIHQKDVSDESLWDQEDLIHFIHKMNLKEKSAYPDSKLQSGNLGAMSISDREGFDGPESDAFYALKPAIY